MLAVGIPAISACCMEILSLRSGYDSGEKTFSPESNYKPAKSFPRAELPKESLMKPTAPILY